jgi:Transposase DDE domain
MVSIPDITQAMDEVLTEIANSLARPSGFVQRASKLSGSLFAKTLVLGWLAKPAASLSELCQVTAELGVSLSPQGLEARFDKGAVAFLEQLLGRAVTKLLAADRVAIPILSRFSAVVLEDSTVIALPDALVDYWQGTGERTGHNQSALKLQVRLDFLTGRLTGPLLQDGRAQDRTSPLKDSSLAAGSLHLADLGFFVLDRLIEESATEVYWLRRLPVSVAVFDEDGVRWELWQLLEAKKAQGADRLDLKVRLGVEAKLAARLLAVRVPQEVAEERRRKLHAEARQKGQTVSQARLKLCDWTVLVTNCPVELLSLEEALVLARVRWQVELLFKLWKSEGLLDQSRSAKPLRNLCEVYAKLLGLLLQHWLLLLSCWQRPEKSLTKAAATVRFNVALLIVGLKGLFDLECALEQIRSTIALGCRMNSRRKKPNTYQLLLNLSPARSIDPSEVSLA